MKFLRILALLMAAMLCLTACSAKDENTETEATAAPEATEVTYDIAPGVATNESFLLKSLNLPYENWMSEGMYSAFAATFFMDMSYVDAYEINAMNEELGIPAVYVGELQGKNYGNGMNLVLFYTNPETSAVTMVNSTVYLKTGLFEGYVQENIEDVAATMEGFVNDGVLQTYHEVSTDEFMSAYSGIVQIISGMNGAQ
ncbi:MAG: hypothetical protein IJC56_09460 [Clostridia bacterium]|nr:hypothetical protein [Clostridia bacterium]